MFGIRTPERENAGDKKGGDGDAAHDATARVAAPGPPPATESSTTRAAAPARFEADGRDDCVARSTVGPTAGSTAASHGSAAASRGSTTKRGRPRIDEKNNGSSKKNCTQQRLCVPKGTGSDGRALPADRVVVRPSERRPWALDPLATPRPKKSVKNPAAIVTPSSDPIESTLYSSDLFHEEDTLGPEALRLMIAGYYVEAMESPPEDEDAQTISWILKEFKMPKGSRNVVK